MNLTHKHYHDKLIMIKYIPKKYVKKFTLQTPKLSKNLKINDILKTSIVDSLKSNIQILKKLKLIKKSFGDLNER